MASNRPSDATRTRLSPEDRREQLLRVTSEIIATDGVDAVRIPYVSAAAGVTRPDEASMTGLRNLIDQAGLDCVLADA